MASTTPFSPGFAKVLFGCRSVSCRERRLHEVCEGSFGDQAAPTSSYPDKHSVYAMAAQSSRHSGLLSSKPSSTTPCYGLLITPFLPSPIPSTAPSRTAPSSAPTQKQIPSSEAAEQHSTVFKARPGEGIAPEKRPARIGLRDFVPPILVKAARKVIGKKA